MSKKQLNSRLKDLFETLEQVDDVPTPDHLSATIIGWTWEIDREGKYISCSPEVSQILGINFEEFLGNDFKTFAIAPNLQEDLQILFENGSNLDLVHISFQDIHGHIIPGVISLSKRFTQQGEADGWRGYTQIAERLADDTLSHHKDAKIVPLTQKSGTGQPNQTVRPRQKAQPPLLAQQKAKPDQQNVLDRVYDSVGSEIVINSSGNNQPAKITVPINLREQSPAFIEVIDEQNQRRWTEDERFLVQEVATQLGLALENAQLYEAVQHELNDRIRAEKEILRRNQDLSALNQIGQKLNRIATPTEILDQLYTMIGQILDNKNLIIALFDQATQYISFPISKTNGQTQSIPGRFLGDGIIEYVIKRRSPLIISSNVESELKGLGIDLPAQVPQSLLAVPMLTGDKVLGVILNQDYEQENVFDSINAEVLSTISSQATIALENARLFQQMQSALAAIEIRERYQKNVARSVSLLSNTGTRSLKDVLHLLGEASQTSRVYYSEYIGSNSNGVWRIRAEWCDTGIAPMVNLPILQNLFPDKFITWVNQLKEKGFYAGYLSKAQGLEQDLMTEKGIRTILLLEVPGKGPIPGFLGFDQIGYERQWGNEEIEALQMAAAAFANTITREDLVIQLQSSLDESESLYNASRRLGVAGNIQEMVMAIGESSQSPTANRGRLLLYEFDPTGQLESIDIVATWQQGKNFTTSMLGSHETLEISDELLFLNNSQPQFLSENDLLHLNPTTRKMLDLGGCRALAILPLWIGKRQFGVLLLISDLLSSFSPREIRSFPPLVGQMAIALENRRLFEQTQAALSETESLYQASADINVALGYNEILDSLRRYTILGEADKAISINLFDRPWTDTYAPDHFNVITRWSVIPEDRLPITYMVKDFPISNQFIGAEYPIQVKSITTDNTIDENFRNYFTQILQTKGVILSPLIVGGQRIGFINAMFSEIIDYSDTEIRRLTNLVGQAAVAVQNLRSVAITQQRADEATMLYHLSQDLLIAEAESKMYQITMDAAHKGLAIDGVSIEMFGVDQGEIYLEQKAHLFNKSIPEIEDGTIFSIGAYPFTSYLLSGQTIVSNDVQIDQRFAEQEKTAFVNRGIRSLAYIPLQVRGQNVGLITIVRSNPTTFSREEIAFLESMAVQLSVVLDNQRLLKEAQHNAEEARRRSEELSLVNHIVSSVAASLDLRAGLQIVIDELAEAFHLTSGGIALFNQERTHLTIIADFAQDGKSAVGVNLAIEGNLSTQEVIRTGKPLVILNPETSPLTIPIHDTMRWRGIKNLTIFPLIIANEVVGTVGLDFNNEQSLSDDEMRLVETIVFQTTSAIENARLFEQTQAALAETELLYKITQSIAQSSRTEEYLDLVVETVLPKEADRAILITFQAGEREAISEINIVGFRDRHSRYQDVHETLSIDHLPLCRSIDKDPLIFQDITLAGLDTASQQTLSQLKIRAACVIPLRTAGLINGILITSNQKPAQFTSQEVRLLQTTADGIAIALERSRLLLEAQRRALELQTAAEIARDTTGTLALDILLSRIVNMLCERFGFYHASIFLLNDAGTYAVVRESTGEAGREMKERGHKLAVGSKSVIGEVTATGKPVVVNDVMESSFHRSNPLLPLTRSELAIPLMIGEKVIGALDVQSTLMNAFKSGDITVLQILTDQIGVAIENARAYEVSQKAVDEMREVDRVKSQFLANMSHELRTPLNSIIGFSKVILKGIDGPINDVQQQDLTAIFTSGEHLLKLINDILDLSKIEAGKMQLSIEEINIPDLITSVLSTITGLVKDKPIKLVRDIEPDLPGVKGDSTRIRQVLLNLLSNAAKFTEQGVIAIQAMRQISPAGKPEIIVRVSDTGPGIAEEDRVKLFLPFSQVDDSPTRKTGGTGLGLSISRSFIEMHNGRIGLEKSVIDEGSTFFFTLPLTEADVVEETEKTSSGIQVNEKKIVLSIDDDRQVISLYERYLSPQGYRVIALTDPSQALSQAKNLKPYAITLDVMMPGIDGWQVLHTLKNDPQTSKIPIIMCSILEEGDKGFSLGAADYLVKPILQEDIVQSLNRLNLSGQIHEILVADDDEDSLRLVQKILDETGNFDITLAHSGQEAWTAITNHTPHAVILDLFMPDLDGFTLLEKMRSDPLLREIPVIVLSGADLTPEQHQQLASFGQELITKGLLREKELLNYLETALRRYNPDLSNKF